MVDLQHITMVEWVVKAPASFSGASGGKWRGKPEKRKPMNKNAGSDNLGKAKVGVSKKPKTGGCHRCGGPHFVRSCPKPVVSS